ncbi:hypothetical protein K8B33_07720 [Alcanivorax sp. JB21]|uniref:hypothetical protein n=1 Tax=Alcanivorax limicola TaxID=2874102 RepID=UPI001CBCA315|nr:hypothetical protein [Alcanivorax limicola]MBZ2188980.1 hypothetical protein [Alcanivorax limicola]
MKTLIHRQIATVLLAGVAFMATPALASTAANTVIQNSVTVSFSDAANNAQPDVTASVSITVNLVASAPLVSVDPTSINPATGNTSYDIDYTVTATANGPDLYLISSASVNTDMNGAPAFSGAASVALGATTVANPASAGDTTIEVPFDAIADGSVNGLAAGDTIILNPGMPNEESVVIAAGGIDESTGASTNVVTLTLETALNESHAIGSIIGQQRTVTVTVLTASTTLPATSGTHVVTTTFTSQEDGAVTVDGDETTITVVRPVLTVLKYVRNVDNAVTGTGARTVNSATYYTAGVGGNPGDLMEYLIVVDNTAAGAVEATDIIITDPIPQFITYESGSLRIDPATADANGSGTWQVVADGSSDNDAGTYDSANETVIFYAGAGGDDATAEGGSLDADEFSFVKFQVRIDN